MQCYHCTGGHALGQTECVSVLVLLWLACFTACVNQLGSAILAH